MGANDRFFLENTLKQNKKQTASSLSDSDFFELFTFEQILKKYYLSFEELSLGKTGRSGDGGIDGFFTFINNEIITNFLTNDNKGNEVLKIPNKRPSIELYLIQSKKSPSFKEDPFNRVIATVMTIFDFEQKISGLKEKYNEKLVNNIDMFREAFMQSQHPELSVYFIYASMGDTEDIHHNVSNKSNILKNTISKYLRTDNVIVEFWGARELLEQSRQEPTYTLNLKFLKDISRGGQNYILLSTLKDYYKFVTDKNGNLRRYIFESNIRDYQGEVGVNKNIRSTLEKANDSADFWWLNNGVTILASKSTISGETITLDDVQIVNGLQTTTEIYNYLNTKRKEDVNNLDRAILIKVIVTQEPETRDRIIKATNYQTPIQTTQISIVTQPIQRDIEYYFFTHDWFYDRRKNYYKNMGKPIDRIISITYLAQAVMAIVLREPHKSSTKGSPSLIITNDYGRVFNKSFKPDVYLFCASTLKTIEIFIRNMLLPEQSGNAINHVESLEMKMIFTPENLYTLRFHMAMFITANLLDKSNYKPADIENLLQEKLPDLEKTGLELSKLTASYAKECNKSSHDIKSIVKDKNFTNHLLKSIDLTKNLRQSKICKVINKTGVLYSKNEK